MILPVCYIPAYGQVYEPFRLERKRIRDEVKYEIGPFKLFPSINLFNVGYDSNVYFIREEDNPISDITATFSPQIKAYLLYRDWLMFSFLENPAYVFYLEQKNQAGWNNIFSSELKLLILNRFEVLGEYLNTKIRRRVTSEFDVPIYEKVRRYKNRFLIETTRKTSIGVSFSLSGLRYEDPASIENIAYSIALDRDEVNYQIEAYYMISVEKLFFIRSGYTEYSFINPESFFRNSHSYQMYSGVQFPITGRMRGALSIGYKQITTEKKKARLSGIVGDTSFELRISRFRFRLSYNRDFPFSTGGSVVFVENSYGFGMSAYVTKFMRFDYDFSNIVSKYPIGTQMSDLDVNNDVFVYKDKYRLHKVGVTFRIIRDVGARFIVSMMERESNLPGRELDRIFIGGNLEYDF